MPMDEPARDCALCPRLAEYRRANAAAWPDWHNAPVPSFGPTDASLLIVGLAPGVRGANRTGRPFTGDYAGDLLYPTIAEYGFGDGKFDARPDDGFRMTGCRITNAVRCVPPENKPTTAEIIACNPYLKAEIDNMGSLRAVLALGLIAHKAVLRSMGLVAARYKFGHGAMHDLPNGLLLADSYHCSRYNTNTGRLTKEMFHAVFAELRGRLSANR
ncbi:MAG: uracil-DNA glycosylase [Pseudomonadota bacterium]